MVCALAHRGVHLAANAASVSCCWSAYGIVCGGGDWSLLETPAPPMRDSRKTESRGREQGGLTEVPTKTNRRFTTVDVGDPCRQLRFGSSELLKPSG